VNPTPTPSPFPPCDQIVGDLMGCCTVTLPNASTWVVCASPAAPPETVTVPTLTQWGGLLFVVLLVAIAVRRLRS
jgi:hypothetical protein